MNDTRIHIRDVDARYAERVADRCEKLGITSHDCDVCGGRTVVVGRKAIYICTDAHAVGNINTFASHEDALRWARDVNEFMCDACN